MAYLLAFCIIVAFTLATASLYRYGNVQRQHILVTVSVLIAWSFSFMIVFTIPLDVTSVNITFDQFAFTFTSCSHYSNPLCLFFVFFCNQNALNASFRRCIANVYTKKMTRSKCWSAQNRLEMQQRIAHSHGEWCPMTCSQVCGVSFIGHRSC